MRRELIGAAVGLSASILLTSLGLAAQAPTTEDFVKTVAISDMFEVQSGQLASEKAQNGDVRSFGKQMVADHTKTSDQLKKLVADKDIKVDSRQTRCRASGQSRQAQWSLGSPVRQRVCGIANRCPPKGHRIV